MSLSDIMSAAGHSSWAEIALVLCFVAFAAIVVYLYALRPAASWELERQLPLTDGEHAAVDRDGKDGDLR